jgi:hypothetical protein
MGFVTTALMHIVAARMKIRSTIHGIDDANGRFNVMVILRRLHVRGNA